MDFIREGGWPMYPILALGLAALALAIRHAAVPQRSLAPLVVGLAVGAVALGLFGTAVGMMVSIRGVDGMDTARQVDFFLKGLRESLNCAALGLLLASATAVATAIGSWRMSRRAEAIS